MTSRGQTRSKATWRTTSRRRAAPTRPQAAADVPPHESSCERAGGREPGAKPSLFAFDPEQKGQNHQRRAILFAYGNAEVAVIAVRQLILRDQTERFQSFGARSFEVRQFGAFIVLERFRPVQIIEVISRHWMNLARLQYRVCSV